MCKFCKPINLMNILEIKCCKQNMVYLQYLKQNLVVLLILYLYH